MNDLRPWDLPEYQRMTEAKFNSGNLSVTFADGGSVTVPAEAVTPSDVHQPRWPELTVNSYELVVPSERGDVEIPWTAVRVLTDRGYSTHLAEAAENQARQVGLRIKELREARNLTGKELAERAGISPQSLSRIENGRHDVVFTTLQRILAAMGCSLADVALESNSLPTVAAVFKRLGRVGISRQLVCDRLLPAYGVSPERLDRADDDVLARMAAAISRVFDWSVAKVLGNDPLVLNATPAFAGQFKMRGKANELHAQAYAVYAHYLAGIVARAIRKNDSLERIPEDAVELRSAIIDRYQQLSFESLLQFAWDAGVAVLPLHDSGSFYGACWRFGEQDVIVLKRMTDHRAGWLVDLGHELWHVRNDLGSGRPGIVETAEIAAGASDSPEEEKATEFANAIALNGKAHELASTVVTLGGYESRLKWAVQKVAVDNNVSTDSLAIYLAYRLAAEKKSNWWPTAITLQTTSPSPWSSARELLISRLDFDQISADDRNLLLAAVG